MQYKELKSDVSKQAKRDIRKAHILDAALKILAFEGNSSFTLRNVADKAGVTLGAVQYYFKNKSDLLLALTEYKLQTDYTATENVRSKSSLNAEEEFLAVINLLLRDNKKPLIYGLDFQLFALACSDKTAEECVNKFYRTIRLWTEDLIKSINPDITDAESSHRTIVILAMIEGLMQVLYRDKRNKQEFSDVEDLIRKETLRIAKGT